jgi:uncharacterized protein
MRLMPERAGYPPGAPSWVDLTAADLQGALAFYGSLFGWEFEDAGEEAGHYHQALKDGKRVAGIGPNQPGTPPMAFWTTYLNGRDVDAHAQAITSAGGRVMFGPLEILDQGRMLVASDPSGAMFGIWEPGAHAGAQLVDEHGTLNWSELTTRDLDASARFYGSVFDYAFEDQPAIPGGYRLIKVGDQLVAGMLALGDGDPDLPPFWLAYFRLDDVDAGFAHARELGGELLSEPHDSPWGRFAPVRDPQGAVFALLGPAA